MSRAQRILVAALGQLWAYWSALDRSDWTAATVLLTTYQRFWPAVRPEVIASFSAASDRATLERQVPMTLAPDGQWGANTRLTVAALLGALFGNAFMQGAGASLPSTAAGLANWWRVSLVARIPRTTSEELGRILWQFDDEVRADTSISAGLVVESLSREVIEGISIGAPSITAGASSASQGRTVVEQGNAQADAVRTSTSPDTSITPAGRAPTQLDAVFIRGRTQRWSAWTYGVIGLGFVTFGALAVYFWSTMKKPTRRRRAR